jgi:hypothetical protein
MENTREKRRRAFLCDLLTTNLPVLPSRCQLSIPFGVNLLLAAGEHVVLRHN